ncbi:predicted protein [Naegleria gruberi]|uniref:Predicted protein n=1 Tax=Naegleria gruberi TaxID=5762 RepID=D2VY27_NAEGR|nr:uncharacterized protein NAEGRDRAFT_73949 [Naegleria gruberi]EFC38291.1 predicted protein [Naegleria gruberi]|eukprot:XP_002671035.1 predicted protein [Naegleria gruberi strain NEG-M]
MAIETTSPIVKQQEEDSSVMEIPISIHTTQLGPHQQNFSSHPDEDLELERRLSTDATYLPIKQQQHSSRLEQILIKRLLAMHWTKGKATKTTTRRNSSHTHVDREEQKQNARSLHYRNVVQKIRKQHLNMKWLSKFEYLVLSICDSTNSNWLENSVNRSV